MDAWYAAFNIQPGDKNYKKPEDRIKVWWVWVVSLKFWVISQSLVERLDFGVLLGLLLLKQIQLEFLSLTLSVVINYMHMIGGKAIYSSKEINIQSVSK
jgi:hypothetical protein